MNLYMNEPTQKLPALSVFVYDFILVSEVVVVELIVERITTWSVSRKNGTVVSVAEYRQLLGDRTSTDERIVERLQFLEAFCRNIIKPELQTYGNERTGTP